MIQEILTGLTIAGAIIFLLWKIRKTGSASKSPCGGCTASGCAGCPALDLKAEAERRMELRNNLNAEHRFEKKMN